MTFWFAEKDAMEEKEALTQLKEFLAQGQQLFQELEKRKPNCTFLVRFSGTAS